ncbi:hypothetical protein ABLU79_06945 [Klebsiella sp. GG_Kp152]|uniref:hypothetical protein n=1 Tax=Klebsiella sp. GG_Kp152 TaxID=3153463 RepID=UPI0032B38038
MMKIFLSVLAALIVFSALCGIGYAVYENNAEYQAAHTCQIQMSVMNNYDLKDNDVYKYTEMMCESRLHIN